MIKLIRRGTVVECKFTKFVTESKIIRKALTIKHPNADFILSRKDDNYKWDGFIKFFNQRDNTFPYGMINLVTEALSEVNIDYKKYGFYKEEFVPSQPFNEKLFFHQKNALIKFFKYKHGIIQIPTRGGKTFMASEAMYLTHYDIPGMHSLFIVDTQDLYIQAIEDIKEYFTLRGNPDIKIGSIKEGVINIESIVVATIQSIQSILSGGKNMRQGKRSPEVFFNAKKAKRLLKKELLDYFANVSFLIVDECHEHTSEERLKMIKKFKNADFRLFISASPFKSESLLGNLNLMSVSGPLLYKVKEDILKEKGILAEDKILLIYLNHGANHNIDVDEDSDYRQYEDQVLVNNERRNNIIVNVSEICRKLNLKTLVLFVYKKHGNIIQGITGDTFLCGEDNINYRNSTKKQFLRKKGGVLLASGIFKKGMTLPEVQVLMNAGGGLEQSSIIQKKGRVLGVTEEKKKALIIDFIDDSEYFADHSLSRIKVYEESVGIDNIVVLDASDTHFYRDTRDFLNSWFEIT